MTIYELIGYIASGLIVFSMLFKTTTYKGTMIMRGANVLGSIAFIIYGFGAGAYPTAAANIAGCIIGLSYLQIEWKSYHKGENKHD